MAKLSASRKGNNTTPDQAPAQNSRATRAGSREPNEPPTPRRSNRNARSTSVESELAAAKDAMGAAAAVTDLTTVDEDGPEEDQENVDAAVDEPEGEQEYALNDTSPSKGSAISGTTNKTTFSQEEFDQLDTDVMLDSLRNLHTASEELLKVLIPSGVDDLSDVWEEISTPGTKAYKLYHKRLSAFLLYKSDYTTTASYVQPATVSRALFDVSTVDEIPQDAPRLDVVLRTANLAYMLHMILVEIGKPDASDHENIEVLETADHAFPSVVAGPSYDQRAFILSIAITTQLAVSQMALFTRDPNYSPQGLATQAFYTEDDDGKLSYRHQHVLHVDSLDEEQKTACLDHIAALVDRLKEPFSDEAQLDPADAVNVLREAYPWRDFLDNNLVPYYMDAKHELDQVVQMAGGIDGLDNQIKTAVDGRDEMKRYQALKASLGQAAGRPKRSAAPDEIQQLRALTQVNAMSAATPQHVAAVAQMTAPMAITQPMDAASQHDGFAPIDQFDEPATAPPHMSRDIHDLSQFQNLKNAQGQRASLPGKGKGRSFNDPQAGARRVGWDEDQSQSYRPKASPGRSQYAPPSALGKRSRAGDEPQSSSGKRARMEDSQEDWDPTQDGGPQDEELAFETKVSDNAAADERRRQAPTVFQHVRPSLSQPIHAQVSDEGHRMTQASPQRKNPGSTVPDPAEFPGSDAGLSRAQEYLQATYTAKRERVMQPSRPPRDRRVWTDLETEALMRYIEEWDPEDNLHYVAMKKLDYSDEGLRALDSRTAEDLRFRARNIKVNLLLGRSEVHDNWKKVQLGKKEIDKLHSRGVPYSQNGLRGAAAANPVEQNH